MTFFQDIKYGIRILAKSPGFTGIAVFTLALGIGVNTALFTGFNVFLRPEPIKDPVAVVRLELQGAPRNAFSYSDYTYLRSHSQSFSEVIAEHDEKLLLGEKTSGSQPEEIRGNFVSDNYISMLGGATSLGRSFTPDESRIPGREPVVVLSNRFWQRRFAADPGIIGRTISLDGKPFTVIGVTSPSFIGPRHELPDLWLPLLMRSALATVYFEDTTPEQRDWFGSSQFQWLTLHARLNSGKTLAEARAEMAMLLPQLAHRNAAETNEAIQVEPLSEKRVANSVWGVMTLVLCASGLVLLIVCSNLANMMLARGAARRKEIGVRLCLGASRWRLVRQLLTESFLLAAVGGVAGVLIAWWSLDLHFAAVLTRYGGEEASRLVVDTYPDLRVLGFSVFLVVLSGLAFGLAPALRATRADVITVIKDESAGLSGRMNRSWLRSALVVAQVSLCLILLVPAGLLIRSLQRVLTANPGFETTRLLAVGYSLELSDYDAQRAQLFQQELMARLAALPGVQSVCVDRNFSRATVTVLNETLFPPRTFERAPFERVPANYLDTIGTPLVQGRGFTEEEAKTKAPVLIISESMARNVWPGESPLGKKVRLERRSRDGVSEVIIPVAEVIGIARDNQLYRIGQIPPLYFYRPESLPAELDTAILVRTSVDAATLKEQARREAYAIEPVLRLFVGTAQENIAHDSDVLATKAASEAASILGTLAMFLAILGIYGVMAWSVAQRTREIGIRIALGARQRNVLMMILKQGMKLVLIGQCVGLVGALAVTRVMTSFLFGLNPIDPLTLVGVTSLLTLVALLACYIPARRATKVNPLLAIRYE